MNSLAVIGDSEWNVLQQQAKALVDSGFLPASVNSPQKAVAIMMLGRELGIPPWAALSTINVIQGKPTVSPQLMLALINRSGQLEDMQVQDEGGTVHVMMKRRGRSEHWASFGQADAIAMNLWSKPNWKSQPATMMKWRAVAACARVVFADVILGLYTPDEMGAEVKVDDEGNMTVIDVAPESIKQLQDGAEPAERPTPPAQPAPASQPTPPTSAGTAHGGSDAPAGGNGDDFDKRFPPLSQPPLPAKQGDDQHLPRTADDLPILGSLNMVEIRRQAWAEKLVKGKEHFANLIDVLWREGLIRAASKPEAVMEAIRKHEAEKEMAGVAK